MGGKDFLKVWLISWLPDIGLSWVYMKLSDNGWSSFWQCLLLLIVVQVFFGIKQVIAGSLIFRLFTKEKMSQVMATVMRQQKFPEPEDGEEFELYMYRLINDESLPVDTRIVAKGMASEVEAVRQTGIFPGLRVLKIANQAVVKYRSDF